MNSYIYGFITNDLTRGALMLTGASGLGKSHYIRSELVPYLKQTPEAYRCLVISLYGVKDLIDVSRSVFLENCAKALNSKSETVAVGAIMAKTILKNLAKQTKLEVVTDKEDFENLYTSVDLSDKLVIFEDIENAKISPAELCGYLGDLAFQDGVKVLLVTNEAIESTEKEELRLGLSKILTETIEFEPDYESFIAGSLAKYSNSVLGSLIGEAERAEIEQCFAENGFYNNRGFFHACRITTDLFRKMDAGNADANYDPDFLKAVFMGILHYSMRRKSGDSAGWGDEYQLSFRLGSDRYPLFRFCYNYLTRQIYEPAQVLRARRCIRNSGTMTRIPLPKTRIWRFGSGGCRCRGSAETDVVFAENRRYGYAGLPVSAF